MVVLVAAEPTVVRVAAKPVLAGGDWIGGARGAVLFSP
jgi:hypothetical protein